MTDTSSLATTAALLFSAVILLAVGATFLTVHNPDTTLRERVLLDVCAAITIAGGLIIFYGIARGYATV